MLFLVFTEAEEASVIDHSDPNPDMWSIFPIFDDESSANILMVYANAVQLHGFAIHLHLRSCAVIS